MIRILITYDITNDKRRNKISSILEKYGKRVNESVFECELKGVSKKELLIKELLIKLDTKNDSLRIYNICDNCLNKSQELCKNFQPFERESVYFF